MPQEYKLVLKYTDQPGYTPDIECYLRHGGYEVLKKALAFQPKTLSDGKTQSPQEQIRQDVMTFRPARPRRRGIFVRFEMEFR